MKLIKNLEWNDYFSNRINNEISSHTDQNTIVLSFIGTHYIHDVLFFGMKTNSIYYNIGQGGHILLENSRFQLNTEATAGSGGNIFSQGIENFVQSKVCCTNCSSNSNGMHSCVYTWNSQNQKSIAEQCSFTQLTGSNGKGILFNGNGYCNFNQINISISDNQMYSCIRIGHIRSESTISSSNFKNNTSSNGVAIDFYNEFPDNQIKQNLLHCNIIEQLCYGNKDGIISARQCLIIDSCVIKDNNAPDSFLFYAAVSISVSNSYIYKQSFNKFIC